MPIQPSSVDLMYLSAVVHGFSPQKMQDLSKEAQRILKPNAVLAIVEIDKKETPFGPPLDIRFSPEELQDIIPLVSLNTIQVGEHFYMQTFKNQAKQEHG
jgi:ubiquinone/menaquinone biosynthesis C-methylase UbiE